jgi:hypothetical protein
LNPNSCFPKVHLLTVSQEAWEIPKFLDLPLIVNNRVRVLYGKMSEMRAGMIHRQENWVKEKVTLIFIQATRVIRAVDVRGFISLP